MSGLCSRFSTFESGDSGANAGDHPGARLCVERVPELRVGQQAGSAGCGLSGCTIRGCGAPTSTSLRQSGNGRPCGCRDPTTVAA